jgi:hypothetical protein
MVVAMPDQNGEQLAATGIRVPALQHHAARRGAQLAARDAVTLRVERYQAWNLYRLTLVHHLTDPREIAQCDNRFIVSRYDV